MSDYRKKIRRQIRRKVQLPQTASRNAQAVILSGLNVLQVLEDTAPKYLSEVLHYGPDTFSGDAWASVLIWYRYPGYHGYKELILFGVWVYEQNNNSTQIAIGTRPLTYRAVVYNPESYNSVIAQSFTPYYGDEASPPDASRVVYQTAFDITRRLALRRELEREIISWMRHTTFSS
ncbi:MAG: hypothetical protein ACFE0Q_15095 [Anaerolineae bacterium]